MICLKYEPWSIRKEVLSRVRLIGKLRQYSWEVHLMWRGGDNQEYQASFPPCICHTCCTVQWILCATPLPLTTKSFYGPRKWFLCNFWPFQMLPTSAWLPRGHCQHCSPGRHQSPCAKYLTWKHLVPCSAGCAPASDRCKMFSQFSSAGSNESSISPPKRLGSTLRLTSTVSFAWLLSEVSWH